MFTAYVAAWLPDILVESSTGKRPSVTSLSEVTRTSAVQWVTTRELLLCCFKATRYTAVMVMEEIDMVPFLYLSSTALATTLSPISP